MRLFRCALLVVAFGVVAVAQAHAQGPIIGFKLGASFSNLDTDQEDEDSKTLTKFTGGGFVRFGAGSIAVQPELMFVTKGAKLEEPGATIELRLDYIEVPLLFLLSFMQGSGIAPFIYAGPAVAFEVGCKVDSVDCVDDGDRKKLDVGAMAGGGLSFPAGPGAVQVEGRYNFGLINLNDSEVDPGSIKNRSGAVLVGYAIPIGRR